MKMSIITNIDRIVRIREMEERMDRAAQWVGALSAGLKELPSVRADILALSSYYESDRWREDLKADEAGELPADLKRGVLSEDGLYNLLAEYEELKVSLRSLGQEEPDRYAHG